MQKDHFKSGLFFGGVYLRIRQKKFFFKKIWRIRIFFHTFAASITVLVKIVVDL